MQILIKRHIESGVIIEREKCLKSLSESGLIITDTENMCFKGKHNLTTDMRQNWRKLFYISLQGQVQIDNNNGIIKWYLNIDSIILKILLTWGITTIGMILLIQIGWKSALFAGAIIGFILFVINRISAGSQIDMITEKLKKN
ncbi:hypothetical protein SAMN05444285_11419 [Draconibacterium orientale]|nr:hypothetical protein [Draconibacterium orientale]SET47653.1 hypothetical protein SAMN05444285_11419 [Draconibacterium orientale]